MAKFLSRKFILAAFVIVASAIFVAFDKLSGGEWVTITGLVIGAFSAGDVALNAIHRDNITKVETGHD